MNYSLISKFQLTNLINQNIPFLSFEISKTGETRDGYEMFFEKSILVQNYKQITQRVADLKLDKSYPLILLCYDTKNSTEFVKKLSKEGFINVYVLDGGYNRHNK